MSKSEPMCTPLFSARYTIPKKSMISRMFSACGTQGRSRRTVKISRIFNDCMYPAATNAALYRSTGYNQCVPRSMAIPAGRPQSPNNNNLTCKLTPMAAQPDQWGGMACANREGA
jgi:hypothetical protein